MLDYGAGRQVDTTWLNKQGYPATPYDKYWDTPELEPDHMFDASLMSYVINVIPSRVERIHALLDVLSHTRRLLYVAVRPASELGREAYKKSWQAHNDGWVTGSNTFQVGYTTDSLSKFLENNLPRSTTQEVSKVDGYIAAKVYPN